MTIGIRNDDRRGAAQRGGWHEVAGNIATGILVVLLGGVATETRGAETKNDPDFATVNPSRAVDSQRADRRRWDADRYVERQSAWEESIREEMSIDGHSAAGPGMPSTASDLRRFGPEGAARYRAAERWRTLGLTDGASSDVLRMLTSSQPDVRVTVAPLTERRVERAVVTLSDANGRVVASVAVGDLEAATSLGLSTADTGVGLHFVTVQTAEGVTSRRVVVH